LESNVTHEPLVFTDDINLLDDNINTIKENRETLLGASSWSRNKCSEDKVHDHVSPSELRTEPEQKDS
jgi:hypothetical protein